MIANEAKLKQQWQITHVVYRSCLQTAALFCSIQMTNSPEEPMEDVFVKFVHFPNSALLMLLPPLILNKRCQTYGR